MVGYIFTLNYIYVYYHDEKLICPTLVMAHDLFHHQRLCSPTITFEVKGLKSLCHLGLTSWPEKWPWDG